MEFEGGALRGREGGAFVEVGGGEKGFAGEGAGDLGRFLQRHGDDAVHADGDGFGCGLCGVMENVMRFITPMKDAESGWKLRESVVV